MPVQYDIGYITPKGFMPVPYEPKPVQLPDTKSKSWLEKVGGYISKGAQALYVGAMGGLDIYERYKRIERGEQTLPVADGVYTKSVPDTGRIVILGQEMNKTTLFVLIGLVILILLIVFWKK